MTGLPSPRVFTTDDPMPVDYPFHLSKVRIGKDQEEIRARVHQIHSHEYLQILMVLHGNIVHESGGKEKTMGSGELVCIPAFQKHRDHYEIGSEVVTISFMPSIVDSLFANPHLLGRSGHFNESLLASFFLPALREVRTIKPRIDTFQTLCTLVEKMDLEQKGADFGSKMRLHARVIEFLAAIQEHVGPVAKPVSSTCHGAIESVLSHLQRHFHHELSVEELIAKSGFSATLFRREFKELTGRSCLQYLNELRIFHAITAIRNTERSLKEISTDVGFVEFATFHRVFKRIKGVGPKTFRDGLNQSIMKKLS